MSLEIRTRQQAVLMRGVCGVEVDDGRLVFKGDDGGRLAKRLYVSSVPGDCSVFCPGKCHGSQVEQPGDCVSIVLRAVRDTVDATPRVNVAALDGVLAADPAVGVQVRVSGAGRQCGECRMYKPMWGCTGGHSMGRACVSISEACEHFEPRGAKHMATKCANEYIALQQGDNEGGPEQ